MSAIFWKNFYICFSKFKCLSTTLPPPSEEDYNHHHHSSTALVKNFNSLYSLTSDSTTSKSLTSTSSSHFFSSSDDSDDTDHSPPDFATIFASQRFFFSSPGHSNSILDSPPEPHSPVTGGVAVQTYSPDPYLDFRQSMQEMVEARKLMDVKANWEYLHELLLCYLSLNPKHTHKFIIGAFADLLVSLMPETATDNRRRPESRRTSTTTSRLRLPTASS